MERKQKVIRIQITVFCVIIFTAVGYLAYFIVSDTLKQPPPDTQLGNLFVAKQQKDIYGLMKTQSVHSCKKMYDEIVLSLKEDEINHFIDNDKYKELDEELKFTYTKQFIILTDKYFEQEDWNDNIFLQKVIAEIKRGNFVERNTPIWDSLTGFENSIACYNEMNNCISSINSTINRSNYFLNYGLSNIKPQKDELLSRSCKQNGNKRAELISSFNELQNKSYNYLLSKIENNNEKFKGTRPYSEINYTIEYYKQYYYNDIENEVDQYNNIFSESDELNKKLEILKDNIESYEVEVSALFEIDRIELGNIDYDGNIIDTYGNTLYASKMRYLCPKIYYTGYVNGRSVYIFYKIYNPNGTLNYNSSYSTTYTGSSTNVTVNLDSNSAVLIGWGNGNQSIYSNGTYRIEIWYNGKKIGEKSFTIY